MWSHSLHRHRIQRALKERDYGSLIKLLSEPTSRSAAVALENADPDIDPVLIAHLTAENPHVLPILRTRISFGRVGPSAVAALHQLAQSSHPAAPLAAQLVHNPQPQEAPPQPEDFEALRRASLQGSPHAMHTLTRLFGKRAVPVLLEAIENRTSPVAAAMQLKKVGTAHAIPLLSELLSELHPLPNRRPEEQPDLIVRTVIQHLQQLPP